MLACALALGMISAILFGATPLLTRWRPQRWLVGAEFALAIVLLAGAGLLIRSFAAIRSTDLGYDPQNVLTNFIALPSSSDGSRTAGALLFERIRHGPPPYPACAQLPLRHSSRCSASPFTWTFIPRASRSAATRRPPR